MKNKILQSISQSIGFKIIFFYALLSLVNMSFVISIIFENQADLISKNTKLEIERQVAKLISSMKKFANETRKGTLFNTGNHKETLNQIIKFIGPHFDDYLLFTDKGVILYKSGAKAEPPKTFAEDGLRSMTAMTFSGNEYYLRIDEEKKMIYCYIPLNEFFLGNSILFVQRDISSLNESLKNLYYQAIYVIIVVLLFHVIFAIILFRYIIYPINLLKQGAERLSKGEFGARISIKRKDEFYALAETFNKMAESLHDNMEALSSQVETAKESRGKAENLAIKDDLTGLFNRTYLLERVIEVIKRARIKKRNSALFLADIDHFSEVDKIYGHQTGDIILMETSKTIRRNCRDTEIVARLGGDEFAVLFPRCSIKHIQDIAEQIRSAVEKNVVITPDGKFSITVSIGISYISVSRWDTVENYQDFLGLADKALQLARENGRNRVEIIT